MSTSNPNAPFTSEHLPTEPELLEPARRVFNAGFKGVGRPFKKGESANPGGYSRLYHRSRRLFQNASEVLAERLIHLALNAEDERVAAMCTITGLGIAGLRPRDYDPATDKSGRAAIDVSRLSDEQREQLRGLLSVMAEKTEAAEVIPPDGSHHQMSGIADDESHKPDENQHFEENVDQIHHSSGSVTPK